MYSVLHCKNCGATALLSEYHTVIIWGKKEEKMIMPAVYLERILDCGCGKIDWRWTDDIDFENMILERTVERFELIIEGL